MINHPQSGLLRKPPLSLPGGEERRAHCSRNFLSPVARGRGAERNEAEWGSTAVLPIRIEVSAEGF